MLRVGAVTKSYPSARALDNVSFAVGRGQIVGFLGPNGAGKTTAMRAVMGLIAVDGGTITWDDQPIGTAFRRHTGYLPAERGLYPRMRVGDQLVYYARLSGLSRTDAAREADHWIDRLALQPHADSEIQALSSGNQQRVQLAMALTATPEMLLLDEPFAGLDPVAVAALSDTLRAEAQRGAAVLLSSHQLDLVADLCRSVVVVDGGRVVLDGQVNELRSSSDTRLFRVMFAGPTNWAPPGLAVRNKRDGVEVRLDRAQPVDSLLVDAREAGPVVGYSYRPPELSEIFLDAVAAKRAV